MDGFRALGSLLGLFLAGVLVWWAFDVPLIRAVAGCVAAAMVIAGGISAAPPKK